MTSAFICQRLRDRINTWPAVFKALGRGSRIQGKFLASGLDSRRWQEGQRIDSFSAWDSRFGAILPHLLIRQAARLPEMNPSTRERRAVLASLFLVS